MYNVFGMAICNGWKDLGARALDAFKYLHINRSNANECHEAPIKTGLQGLKYLAIIREHCWSKYESVRRGKSRHPKRNVLTAKEMELESRAFRNHGPASWPFWRWALWGISPQQIGLCRVMFYNHSYWYIYIYIEIYSLLGQYSIWDNFETTPNEIKWRSCGSGLQSWLHVRTYQD